MRVKYKHPKQFLFRRFWRVSTVDQNKDGSFTVVNRAGKILHLPAGMVVIVVS